MFFRTFRSLAAAVRPVDDKRGPFPVRLLTLGKVLRRPFRQDPYLVEGSFENRSQPLSPLIDPRLTHFAHLAQEGLQRIGLLVDQDE